MPFGALLAFAGAVFERFIGRQREVRDGLAAGGVARLGIAPEASNKNRFVDGHGEEYSGKRSAWEGRRIESARSRQVRICYNPAGRRFQFSRR